MYNQGETKWFSQTLMTFKDKEYATDGYLRLSLSTNTEDYQFFNPPVINISITNNYQKSINLNIQNAKDLIKAFKTILPQLNGNELNIQRKYQKNTILHITFKLDSNKQKRIVVIEIRNNESDFTKIIIPLEGIFESFAYCIREFTDTYMNICSRLLTQSIQSESTKILHHLPSLIKGISSQIISQIPAAETIEDSRAAEVEPEVLAKTEATINDLDKFLGEDMGNIDVPEIEKVEKETTVLTEVDSLFVKNFIDGDLSNLESSLTNYFMTPAPLMAIAADIKTKIGADIDDENFTTLPSATEDDIKSMVYLSKLFSSLVYQNYYATSEPMPATTPVFKYNPTIIPKDNLDIAYDLFLFNLYVRSVRRRLENTIQDAIENKALFYIQLRCFTDPFVFSFLQNEDHIQLTSIILTRFRYYNEIGVFNYYKELLEVNKCKEISEMDITSSVAEAIDKVIGKSLMISDLHESMINDNSLRVPAKNTFSLEQIINEILPLEIAEKTGKDIKNNDVIAELKETHDISDEILKIFKDKVKKIKTTKTNKTSNLERIIRTQFIDEVPEQYRDNFLQYVLKLGDNKFIMEECEYPIDEFGDNVIKALYLWDPETDPVVAKNYKQFFLKVEQELMERDLIIAKIKTTKTEITTDDGGWDFLGD